MIGLPLLIAALGVMLAMIRQRVHVRALVVALARTLAGDCVARAD